MRPEKRKPRRDRIASALLAAVILLTAPSSCATPRSAGTRPANGTDRAREGYECDCTVTDADPVLEIESCLGERADGYQVQPGALERIARVHGGETVFLHSRCGAFLARRDGRARGTQLVDNGPDYPCDGRVRYVRGGRYGYMDESLKVIVEPVYGYAHPYREGVGIVCNGCSFDSDGEHTSVSCDECGAVDVSGNVVVPVGPSYERVWQQVTGPEQGREPAGENQHGPGLEQAQPQAPRPGKK